MSLSGFARVLHWSDFQEVLNAPPDSDPQDGAETVAGFDYRSQIVESPPGTFSIKRSTWAVTTSVDTTKSWVVKGHQTAALLAHEQGHYDLSAVAARQFHDDALALTSPTGQELTAALEQLEADTFSQWLALQTMYDEDVTCGTQHGLNAHFQAQWLLWIKDAKARPTSRLSDLSGCPAK